MTTRMLFGGTMKQYTFKLDETATYEQTLAGICSNRDYKEAQARLLVVFEPNCDPTHCELKVRQMTDALPEAHVCGMTTIGAKNELVEMPRTTTCTLLLFEQSDIFVHAYDCHDMTAYEAGQRFVEELKKLDDVKGVLTMTSCITLQPSKFGVAVSEAFPALPVFGAQAGTSQFGTDFSTIMVDGSFYDRGIMAIALAGENLHIRTDFNMGFRPIGREFTITDCDANGVVNTIENLPALSLYQRYLNLEPNEYFFENVCAFPLIEQTGQVFAPRVPVGYTPEGGLRFSMYVKLGSKVSLSYSRPEYLLRESLASANGMATFNPEAIIVFGCMDRRVFMGNERADRELGYYSQVLETACYGYGYGEILKTEQGGGVLNSALVAVGMREGDPVPLGFPKHVSDPELSATRPELIPLSDRLVAFLEAMTADLRSTIDGLTSLAEHDVLTGLYNRRYMDELLEYELSRLGKTDSLVLIMFDIDHFKVVNDTYGHEVGDMVLKGISRCVEEAIRSHDVLCRWGGEEFLLLFTRAAPELAFMLGDRIRRHVEQTTFDVVGHVTVSVGVTIGMCGDSVESLFNRVDGALYDAKNSGRNRVCQR